MNDNILQVVVDVFQLYSNKLMKIHNLDTKAQQYLQGIQSTDEGQQLQAVIEMCQVIDKQSISAIS